MNKEEFIANIKSKENNIYCLVGPNTTGKSYILNMAFNQLNNKTLFIDEEGNVKTKDNRNKIKIINELYVYSDERKKGNRNKEEEEVEKINSYSLKIIQTIRKYLAKINTKNKSLGSTKLYNILNTLLSYNLNNIEYILIDEPENFLDDENLKIINIVFECLKNNNKSIILVTHSPRLLELMRIKIDDIYYLKQMFGDINNIKIDEIRQIYMDNGISLLNFDKSITISEVDKYDFIGISPMMDIYLDNLLYSYDFYRTLFYSGVIILEGHTEKLIINELKDYINYSNNYFIANGKNRIPFLIKLFSLLNLNITCFIDTDKNEGEEINKLPQLLTNYIGNLKMEKIEINCVQKDMENYLNIDNETIIKVLSCKDEVSKNFINDFIKKYKTYICYYSLKNNRTVFEKAKNLFCISEKYAF